MSQFENVSVVKMANVYFEGKCVSHTVVLHDGSRKSVGVIFPSVLTFNTDAPECMELISGTCKVRLSGETDWISYGAGESFDVPAKSEFDIETREILHYVCHFA
jgi:uncharacterized protein YaiE (UPF0345 family)